MRTVLLYQITLELKVNTPNEITSQKYEKIKVHISETGEGGKQRQIVNILWCVSAKSYVR